MARLPTPGSDNGSWGTILNDFLSQAHNTDGSLKNSAVSNSAIADGTIQEAKLSSAVQTKLNGTSAYFSASELSDGSLPATGVLDSGQSYAVTHSGGSGFNIVNGGLQANVALAYLNFGPLPNPVREYWIEVSWSNDGQAAWEPAVMIVSDGPFANNYPAGYADAGLHLLVYGNRFVLQKRRADGGGSSATLASWTYNTALTFNERHRIGVMWNGSQISILHHEGIYTQSFDQDVVDWWGPYACMEIVGSTSGFNKVSVHNFHVSSEALPPTAALQSGLETKVSKTSIASQVYGTTSLGAQATFTASVDANNSTIALRNVDGTLKVGNPTAAAHAVHLAYLEARVVQGTGSPEGVRTAAIGTVYERIDGGAGTSLYIKESGAGNTGWVTVTTDITTKVDKVGAASQIYGTTSGGAQTTYTGSASAVANTVVLRDPNANLVADAFIATATSTATAGGTTVLTVNSTQTQVFTGSSNQTVTLPTTSIVAGQMYIIINNSSGTVMVNSSGGNLVSSLAAGASALCIALTATPTTAANWRAI